jgi:hypothetical protein
VDEESWRPSISTDSLGHSEHSWGDNRIKGGLETSGFESIVDELPQVVEIHILTLAVKAAPDTTMEGQLDTVSSVRHIFDKLRKAVADGPPVIALLDQEPGMAGQTFS